MPLVSQRRYCAIAVMHFSTDGQQDLVMLNSKVYCERGDLQYARVNVDEHAASEWFQQILSQAACKIPDHIVRSRDRCDGFGGFSECTAFTKVPMGLLRIEQQQCTSIPQTILTKTFEKTADQLAITRTVAGRLHDLQPEDIVPECLKAERILDEASPKTSASG